MKMAASCQTNMSPKHYIKRLQTRKQLWKLVRTSFQKRLLQPFKSSSGLSIHASSYYVWLFISSLTFHAVIFNISLSLVAVCTDFEFDKFRDTAPSITYSQFHFSSLQLDRILYNLLAMLSTDILGIWPCYLLISWVSGHVIYWYLGYLYPAAETKKERKRKSWTERQSDSSSRLI